MENQVIERKQDMGVFASVDGFEAAQRMAKMLSQSELVPKNFQGKLADCVIALEISRRTGASPLFVMQNLYIVHGKPSWSSQFAIAAVNSCGKFSPIRFQFNETKTECFAWAMELDTDERLEGPTVSIEMAKSEGWYQKTGSKWKTMPELMLRYRAATFFSRLYAPEIMMGMRPVDEIRDIEANKGNAAAWDIEIDADPVVNENPLQAMAEEIKAEVVVEDKKPVARNFDDILGDGVNIDDLTGGNEK